MSPTRWLLTTLTLINASMLVVPFMHAKRVEADDVAPVIRARGLQIVDEQGRVRAELKVSPPVMSQDNKMVLYPEAAELRLLSPTGEIVAGFSGTQEGGEIAISGMGGQVHVNSRQPPPLIWITNSSGSQKWTAP